MRALLKKLVLLASDARSKLDAPSSEPVRDGLREDVETLYKRYLREAELNYRKQGAIYGLLALSLDAVIAASTAAAREIVEGEELVDPEGTNWDLWICFLHQILERHDLPRGIRKDRDKSDKSSAFVDFVEALQSALPKEFRRFDHSRGALAQGMTRARRRYL